MNEPVLPGRDALLSHRNNDTCIEDEYARASEVWQAFNWTRIEEKLELYLKTDVIFFADVFQEFREVLKGNYGLDPAYYVSSPQLS